MPGAPPATAATGGVGGAGATTAPPSAGPVDTGRYRHALASGIPREQVKEAYIQDGIAAGLYSTREAAASDFERTFPAGSTRSGPTLRNPFGPAAPETDFPVPATGL